MNDPNAVLLMKIGFHAQEELLDILDRKKEEEKQHGYIFWGYGGSLCHPLKVIKPFAEEVGDPIKVLFILTPSKYFGTTDNAMEYSIDGKTWMAVPKKMKITSSRYALVLKDLKTENFLLNTKRYKIPVGKSAGKSLCDYFRGRVDKAVGLLVNNEDAGAEKVRLRYSAKLISPYSVFLR